MNTNKRIIAAATVSTLTGIGLVLAGCSSSPTSNSTKDAQQTTEQYAAKLTAAEPYPLSQMNDSAERANLRERLLRLNDPHKIGYVYELTATGQVIASYTVKGKVSSSESQLTNTDFPYANCTSCSGGGPMTTVSSMNDDGSYGPNAKSIFFFTTSGVMVEWNGLYTYSDAPLNLTSKPLITVDETAKPTSTAGQLK